jgi:hypothetical protein
MYDGNVCLIWMCSRRAHVGTPTWTYIDNFCVDFEPPFRIPRRIYRFRVTARGGLSLFVDSAFRELVEFVRFCRRARFCEVGSALRKMNFSGNCLHTALSAVFLGTCTTVHVYCYLLYRAASDGRCSHQKFRMQSSGIAFTAWEYGQFLI